MKIKRVRNIRRNSKSNKINVFLDNNVKGTVHQCQGDGSSDNRFDRRLARVIKCQGDGSPDNRFDRRLARVIALEPNFSLILSKD